MKKLQATAESSTKVEDEETTETAIKESIPSQKKETSEIFDKKVKKDYDETYNQEQDAHYDVFDDIYDTGHVSKSAERSFGRLKLITHTQSGDEPQSFELHQS
ncbi:hypothetical protein M7I_4693 [Glarea lozoyensis 74030]|uniref:Uncharacterized protein n=1 Tax=Glarea lozoyensis (strain ATCC 74030 / MF5533) TaxID=1104152 RepID=H0EPV5_GLAL7|nr:hypothetical protein M7I_4693 [Glarea lozoyensis 74030]